jgi:hypothetical protein
VRAGPTAGCTDEGAFGVATVAGQFVGGEGSHRDVASLLFGVVRK